MPIMEYGKNRRNVLSNLNDSNQQNEILRIAKQVQKERQDNGVKLTESGIR